MFSNLDLRWGYHQIELHPESRVLTTFPTHKGLKRYKHLIYGLQSAPEMYQYVIQRTLQEFPELETFLMILLCLALTKAVMTGVWNLLSRFENTGLTLNREKCVFSVPELVFFGFKISANGVAPDDKKFDAVRNA